MSSFARHPGRRLPRPSATLRTSPRRGSPPCPLWDHPAQFERIGEEALLINKGLGCTHSFEEGEDLGNQAGVCPETHKFCYHAAQGVHGSGTAIVVGENNKREHSDIPLFGPKSKTLCHKNDGGTNLNVGLGHHPLCRCSQHQGTHAGSSAGGASAGGGAAGGGAAASGTRVTWRDKEGVWREGTVQKQEGAALLVRSDPDGNGEPWTFILYPETVRIIGDGAPAHITTQSDE